jgi:serine/threonine-protein kinase
MKCPSCGIDNRDTAKFCNNCGYQLTKSPSAPVNLINPINILPPSTTLQGRYRIKKALHQGGMGTIYLANDNHLTSECVVKEMIDQFSDAAMRADAVQRFQQEAKLLASLAHPNILHVMDLFTEGQKHYLVTPFIRGRNLLEHLQELGGVAPETKVIQWAQTICDVLATLHSHHPPIIYRDLKPENIMITDTGHLVLIDFGIARHFQAGVQGTMIGTPGYAPPEQWQGLSEPCSDLYALGATMHHLLTGVDPRSRPPFVFDPVRKIKPSLSSSIEQIIDKLLQMRADQRYPNVTALKQALLNVTRPVQPVVVPPPPQPKPTVVQPQPQPSRPSSTIIHPVDSAEMILIPEGEFIMGTSDEQIKKLLRQFPSWNREWFANEQPQHRFYLDDFYIDKYPVTNAQFEQFVNATGYKAESDWGDWRKYYTKGKEKHPVVFVSWNDANTYCKWAGKRLPTEAEWEKAARGTDGRIWPWGNAWDKRKCNSSDGGPGTTMPVGSYPAGASPYGVMDMAGNVCEWCADWYDENYYASAPNKNPQGPSSGTGRVLRGGSWSDNPSYARAAFRLWNYPVYGYDYDAIGFRGSSLRLPR